MNRLKFLGILILVILVGAGCETAANNIIVTQEIQETLPAVAATETPGATSSVPKTPIPQTVSDIPKGNTIRHAGKIILQYPFPPIEFSPATPWAIQYENKNAFFDLDSANISNDGDADMYYWITCGSECFHAINMVHGALSFFELEEYSEPGFQGCQDYIDKKFPESLSFISMIVNSYSCIITNEGRLAQVKINDMGYEQESNYYWAEFTYVVWEDILYAVDNQE